MAPARRSLGALGGLDAARTIAGWIREDLGDVPVLGVTHSLGGILARHMTDLLCWKGLVMLAPPNRGSRLAARFTWSSLFRSFLSRGRF